MGKKSRNMRNKMEEMADIDALLEKLLEITFEQFFIIGVKMLVLHSRCRLSSAINAILSWGRISGEEKDILSNILKNSLKANEHGYNPKLEPSNIVKLARFSMDCLIDMILKHESKPTKTDIIVFLLCSDYLLFDDYFTDNIDLNNNMEKPETGAPCLNIDLGEMLKQLPWFDLEPLLPNTGEGISEFEDFKYKIKSENSFDNLESVYDACKKKIVKEKVKFEERTGKTQKDLKGDIEKAKEKLAQINEKKGQLYALFKTEERLYRIEKINRMYKFNDTIRRLFEKLEQTCKDELEKSEHQLSQLSQMCSFSSVTRFV